MQPTPIDTTYYRRSYVRQGYPYVGTCGGGEFLNCQTVDLLNRTYRAANKCYLCLFHSHGTAALPNDIPSLVKEYNQLIFDVQHFEGYLRTMPVPPFVRQAIINEISLDKIRMINIEYKIGSLSKLQQKTSNEPARLLSARKS